MRAYKWLLEGGEDLQAETKWPTNGPSAWVRMQTRLGGKPTAAAVDADHLANGVSQELWEIELDGPRRGKMFLFAKRGRLLQRITAWNEQTAQRYVDVCIQRSRAHLEELLRIAEEWWEGTHIGEVIKEETNRDLFDRLHGPTSFEDRFGPSPPLKPEGMDMLTSKGMGDPRLSPTVEADFDRYARTDSRAGLFYMALWTAEHVGYSDTSKDPLHEASIVSDSAPRVARNLDLGRIFQRFARGETSSGQWFQVIDAAWDKEVVWLSQWLRGELGLS
jgi:hypothetical protein